MFPFTGRHGRFFLPTYMIETTPKLFLTEADINRIERQRKMSAPPIRPNATPLSVRIRETEPFHTYERAERLKLSLGFDDIDFKTLFSTSAGFAPANNRTSVVVGYPQRRTVLSDLIPQDVTRLQAVSFMRETTEVLDTGPVAEGAVKPEAQFAYTEVTAPVVKIPAYLPFTEEALDDVDGLENLIDRRMLLRCLIAEEDEFLNGTGGAGNIDGFYNATGVLTQTQGADTLADAIFKAISKVRFTGRAEATAVLIHPDDYESERLRKDTLGQYIWGPPTLPPPAYIWEKLAVVTDAATAGSPLVGDFASYAHISRRMEGNFSVSKSHGENFARNILALRAEVRSSLEIYRPSAFCYVV